MLQVTDYRNPAYSAEGANQIDLEILTDKYGWIPTTIQLDDDDRSPHIIQISNWLIENVESIAQYVAPIPTPEEELAIAKQARTDSVAAIQVTTTADNTFDGDEVAQSRMSRAIQVLGTDTIQWKLADNTFAIVDVAELTEALALAGQAQADLWVQFG